METELKKTGSWQTFSYSYLTHFYLNNASGIPIFNKIVPTLKEWSVCTSDYPSKGIKDYWNTSFHFFEPMILAGRIFSTEKDRHYIYLPWLHPDLSVSVQCSLLYHSGLLHPALTNKNIYRSH